MTDYRTLAAAQEDYIISMRRYFHEHPEISRQEEGTIARICEELETIGVPYVDVPNGGVFAFIGDESRGRTVLLRADVDALPGKESALNGGGKPKVCVSLDDSASHTCGHDCHAAMLLGAARALKQIEDDLPGRVVLMFERGEEGGGNLAWLLKWAFDHGLKIDTSFGAHVFPTAPTGKVMIVPGPAMAGAIPFRIKFIGKAVHGSAPSEGNNPIDCFAAVYSAMQAMRMRYANPFDAMVFSVGQVHSGFASNIIPPELEFSGSFRVLNYDDALRVHAELTKTVEKMAEIYNCQVEAVIRKPTLSLVNDPECAQFSRKVFADVLGADAVTGGRPNMASESHCLTAFLWPGTYAFIGIYNEEKGMIAQNHNECFEPDEDALAGGAACYIAYAAEFLKNGPDTSDRVYRGELRDFFRVYNPTSLAAFGE